MIVIVDYQMGNPGSIRNMLKRIGAPSLISSDLAEIKRATKLILPGVGAFDRAIQNLQERGMVDVLSRRVMAERTPILGICLGMQLMTRSSEEGASRGLGWIDAETVRFKRLAPSMKVPHMGWDRISPARSHPLFEGLGEKPRFYFVHSFCVRCTSRENALATSTYGCEFDSVIAQEHMIGVQFHPEKSHRFGMRLLKNFAEL